MAALTKLGWLAYALAFLALYAGFASLGGAALLAGIACHWRFWRIGLPLFVVAFFIGWHRGSRKH
jgi:hypothetical protein